MRDATGSPAPVGWSPHSRRAGLRTTALPALLPAPSATAAERALDLVELGPGLRDTLTALAWTLPSLLLAGFFAMLRVALLRSHAGRVLALRGAEKKRETIEPLLQRADRLAISAEILEVAAEIVFLVYFYRALAENAGLGAWATFWTVVSEIGRANV